MRNSIKNQFLLILISAKEFAAMLKIKLVSAIFAAFIGIILFIAFSSMQREQLDAAAKQNQLL